MSGDAAFSLSLSCALPDNDAIFQSLYLPHYRFAFALMWRSAWVPKTKAACTLLLVQSAHILGLKFARCLFAAKRYYGVLNY
jgi:hypothetical protein